MDQKSSFGRTSGAFAGLSHFCTNLIFVVDHCIGIMRARQVGPELIVAVLMMLFNKRNDSTLYKV
ncbi:hypothetical protein BpHYR1_007019 [Brachionus plicatilis]|uniref:Uncharacterized protein n=1 Tax=Brachionus plicatilis TaxID=10195 RepID=A0A3M7RIB2_BRAPC|nr:hypothetical protein BpHYR1_007019 [Brachionus plicatilis]